MSLDVLRANRIFGQVSIEPTETLFDPVSKMRVSTPSNLIDTDFEYGLQSTKWETLELINNIPTFFAREGTASLSISAMHVSTGSSNVSVESEVDHGLTVGTVIIVKGARFAFADGTYAVTTVPSSTTFTYTAKSTSPITANILEVSTEIVGASLYQGTEFKLENLGAITTDGEPTSTITIQTKYPHGFKAGTSFILLNSLTSTQVTFDSTLIQEKLYALVEPTINTWTVPTEAYLVTPVWQTVSNNDPGSAGMTQVVQDETPEDTNTYIINFPAEYPFYFFGQQYEKIWVSTDSAILFTNSTASSPAVGLDFVNTVAPRIEMFGNGWWATPSGDFQMMGLYYEYGVEGMRVRYEGKVWNDPSVTPTLIWELFFDTTNYSTTVKLYRVPAVGESQLTYPFAVTKDGGANPTIALQHYIDDFIGPNNRYIKELWFITNYNEEITDPVNGYSQNSASYENTSPFVPYRWDADKTVSLQSGMTKPSLYFTMGCNYFDYLESAGITDLNWIEDIRHNVIRFKNPHNLFDGRPYLYTPGIRNNGLFIGTTAAVSATPTTTPAVYYLRTSGSDTSVGLGTGIYTFTGSSTTATATTTGTNVITTAANGTLPLWIGDTVVFATSIGGLVANKPYYVKTILSANQFTVSDTVTYNGAQNSAGTELGTRVPGDVVPLSTQTLTVTLYTGGIITDPTRELVISDRNTRTTCRFVNFGQMSAAQRFSGAYDRVGPHAFMACSRAHWYTGVAGNWWITSLDSDANSFAENQPWMMHTTAVGNLTNSTNNYSTLFTPYYARNVNSSTLTYNGVARNPGIRSYATNGATASVAAVTANAETITLTVLQNAIFDKYNNQLGMSFTSTDVDVGLDTISIPNHGLTTNDSIIYTGPTVSGFLTTNTTYFAIVVDANTIKVATSAANANAGTAINLTATPAGGTTVYFVTYTAVIGHEVNIINAALNAIGISKGFVQAHSGTTTRTFTIKLDNAALAAVAAQNNNVEVEFKGSVDRTTLAFNVSTASGGANLNLVAPTNPYGYDGYLIPAKYPLVTDKSFYSANHGFQQDDLVLLSSNNTLVPGGLTNNTYYKVEYISDDRFRLKTTTGTVVNLTSSSGLSSNGYYVDYNPYDTETTLDTATWLWNINAVAANATSGTMTYPMPFYTYNKNVITLPNTNAGSYTFNISAAATVFNPTPTIPPAGTNGGMRLKFYNAADGSDFLLQDGTNINTLDIRMGTHTGTTTRAIQCVVMTPGGLPSNLVTSTQVYMLADVGFDVRDENRAIAGSSWTINKWMNSNDNSYFPMLEDTLYDSWETSQYPATTLRQGRVSAVTTVDPITITYTFPSNRTVISTAVRSNNVVTIRTTTAHGYKEGASVTIAGVTDTGFNGTFVITNVTPYTFTYAQTAANANSVNGTADQLVNAYLNRSATISSISKASPAVVTTSAAHNMTTGQPFYFTGVTGADWGDLWNGKVYYIKVLTSTTFEVYEGFALSRPLDTTGFTNNYVQGTNGGIIWGLGAKLDTIGSTLQFTTRTPNIDSDTLYVPNHNFNSGTSVTYTAGGGTAIGGLTAGNSVYVQPVNTDLIRLSTTSDGWRAAAFNVTGITVGTGTLTTATQTTQFVTGNRVQYLATGTPITGLTNGAYYYVRSDSATTCRLYWTLNGATNALATELVNIFDTLPAGTHSLRETTTIDLTTEGVGDDHALTTSTSIGTADGLYVLNDPEPNGDKSKFTLNNPSNTFIPQRTLAISSASGVDLTNDAFYFVNHGLVTGTPITYSVGLGSTSIATLNDSVQYYTVKVNNDYFRLASSIAEANTNVYITLNDGNFAGSGTHEFNTGSIVGAITAAGSITVNAGTSVITGSGTSFTANYRAGDTFYWSYTPPTAGLAKTTTFVGAVCTSAAHNMSTKSAVRWNSTGAAPTGVVNGNIYYVRWTAANTFQLYPTPADAVANTNAISLSGGSGTHTVTLQIAGRVGRGIIDYVNSNTKITLTDAIQQDNWEKLQVYSVTTTAAAPSVVTVTFPYTHTFAAGTTINLSGTGNTELDTEDFVITSVTATTVVFNAISNLGALTLTNGTTVGIYAYSASSPATYDVTSSLLIRSDSAVVHRPYDGGCDIVASNTPQSKVIRQTRRYFRYQSGKGIQVSFAVNFSPTVGINKVIGGGDGTATITTRVPHRMTVGVNFTIKDDTSDVFNGTYSVATIVDDYTFTFNAGFSSTAVSTGRPEFFVVGWADATIRCGLFDDQNGMYFEYDGNVLSVCRKNSTTQLGGTINVEFGEARITGNDTNFVYEVQEGDNLVIKGQTYKIVNIASNSELFIQPSYRGSTANNAVASLVKVLKVPQNQWNVDVCDGTGITGYNLNIHTIQMAYMDYSWYGAGKVRFGFKDTNGKVRYVHEFIHNNYESEAYLRSGNLPARYEVETGASPTFIPNLAHWGTSVIMDGGYQDDKAYLFSAISNSIYATNAAAGSISVTTAATTQNSLWNGTSNVNVSGQNIFYAYDVQGNLIGEIGYAAQIATHSDVYYSIPANAGISGTGIRTGTLTASATSARVSSTIGSSPYLKDVIIGYVRSGNQLVAVRKNLLIINKQPANGFTSGATLTVTASYDFTQYIPLLSVRLAPSVDNGIPGGLGVREIINRMQLNLQQLDVLSTHECEFQLVFNAYLDNLNWKRVTSPSLSQVVYHSINDTITGGSVIYTFLSPSAGQQYAGATNAQREFALNTLQLNNIATLGNSILGGDGVFPDGPDVVTLRMRYIGLPGLIGVGTASTAVSPLRVACRLSWAESQA
jgi:hypothetical protein